MSTTLNEKKALELANKSAITLYSLFKDPQIIVKEGSSVKKAGLIKNLIRGDNAKIDASKPKKPTFSTNSLV